MLLFSNNGTKSWLTVLHKKVLMISIVFLLLIGLFILAYLYYLQKKKNKLLKETIQELEEIQEIKTIKSYLKGRDEERARIAEDWHDGIGNSLSTLRLIVDTIQPKNLERHTEALSLLEYTQREFRQVIYNELVNDFIDKAAIMQTFKKWAEQLQFGNIELILKVYDLNSYDDCQPIFKTHLYRIVQELLTNSIKHAEATQIKVEFKTEKNCLVVNVGDNGRGTKENFEDTKFLRSVNRRLSILNGKIRKEAVENRGTIIHLRLPLSEG